MRLALATYAELAQLHEDDRSVIDPLHRLGMDATPEVWDDPKVRWSEFDAVILRSTWNYYLTPAAFLAWVDLVGQVSRLWNPPAVVRWNSHKSYLNELAARGVPVVPTELCPDLPSALRTIEARGWDRAILKAAVSAGAYRTYRVDRSATFDGPPPWVAAPPLGELLVQPYFDEVERSGERSLVFLRGVYSHAFLRAPRLQPGSTLVEGRSVQPSEDELALGRAALAAAPGPTLYGRVDMVRDPAGIPTLMELELIEPHLHLLSHPTAASAFAQAIAQVVAH